MPIYKVSIEIEALVYARSKSDAKRIAGDALVTEHAVIGSKYDNVRVWDSPPEDSFYPDEWDEQTIIYNDDERDDHLTVAEARKLP